jgi:hypothetical protein
MISFSFPLNASSSGALLSVRSLASSLARISSTRSLPKPNPRSSRVLVFEPLMSRQLFAVAVLDGFDSVAACPDPQPAAINSQYAVPASAFKVDSTPILDDFDVPDSLAMHTANTSAEALFRVEGEARSQTVVPALLLTRSLANVSGNVLSEVRNSGAILGERLESISLTSDMGTVVKNPNGTWTWSDIPRQPYLDKSGTIKAESNGGQTSIVTFKVSAFSVVSNRQVFYKGSSYAQLGGVNAALDPSKILLRSSTSPQVTSSANVVNYSRGINGVVLDFAGLAKNTLSLSDFSFRVAPAGVVGGVSPNDWPLAPTPSVFDVTPGIDSIPTRVRLEWEDNLIQNTWLQILVKANANTGLVNREVYYLGHAMADVSVADQYQVSSSDLALIQGSISNSLLAVSDVRDVNKDRRVTAADLSFVQVKVSESVLLQNLLVPSAGSAAEGEDAVSRTAMPKAPVPSQSVQPFEDAIRSVRPAEGYHSDEGRLWVPMVDTYFEQLESDFQSNKKRKMAGR